MTTQAQDLAEKLKQFNEEMIAFIKGVTEKDWRKTCQDEQWRIGVVARHVGTGHYGIMELAKLMIAGAAIPEFSSAQVAESNKAHAAKHSECTREEVVSILEYKGKKLVDYVSGLSDADLAKKADISEFGGEINVKQLFQGTILTSAAHHLDSMRRTIG